MDPDAAAEALARDEQDPSLPSGVSLDDLHRPIVACDPDRRAPPLALLTREAFRGARRDPEHGGLELLDALAIYASFARGPSGAPECLRADANLAAMLDRAMP